MNIRSLFSFGVIVSFLLGGLTPLPCAYADTGLDLPAPGQMVHLSSKFTPASIKGIVYHPENPFKFDFIMYKGDQNLSEAQKKLEYNKLIKYFLASLAIPDEDQWVNLSPYEQDRMIKDNFGKTLMGRDLLAQDYLLKQLTASMIYPKDRLGHEFWNEVYARAYKQFGTHDIPVNTYNKVWIMPDEADIYESGRMAYMYKSHLKVMLDEDYLSLMKHGAVDNTHSIGSDVIRQIVIPLIEKEVNEGQNFASLRQAYSGMIMAAWYKRALRQSLLGAIYTNKAQIKGVDQDPSNNEIIYQRYIEAFKKGVFNFIKDDADQLSKEKMPRKYFSGGTTLAPPDAAMDAYGMLALPFIHVTVGGGQGEESTAADLRAGRGLFDLVQTTFNPAMVSQSGAPGENPAMVNGAKTQAKVLTIAALWSPDPNLRQEAAQYFAAKGDELIAAASQNPVLANHLTLLSSTVGPQDQNVTVASAGLAVTGDDFIKIKNVWGVTETKLPDEVGMREIQIRVEMPNNGGRRILDILTNAADSQTRTLSKHIQAYGEGIQHVEIWTDDIDAAAKDIVASGSGNLINWSDQKPKIGVNNSRVFFLRVRPEDKFLVQLVQRPSAVKAVAGVLATEVAGKDNATLAEDPGGVIFNAQLLKMNIKIGARGMVLPVKDQDINNIHLDGLSPDIYRIISISSITFLFSLSQSQGEELFEVF